MFPRQTRPVRVLRNRRQVLGGAIESLEQRLVFSTLTVNTLADNVTSDNFLSLREAVLLVEHAGDASAALSRALTTAEESQIDSTTTAFGTSDKVIFGSTIATGTLDLDSPISIANQISIEGTAGDIQMTLTGGSTQAAHQAFVVLPTGDLSLSNMLVSNFSVSGTTSDTPTAGEGGAIYVDGGALRLTDVSMSSNAAIGGNQGSSGAGAAARGGAIFNHAGTVIITGGSISSNTVTGGNDGIGNHATGNSEGGAIYSVSGTLTITDTSFIGNTATKGHATGGAIYQSDGEFTLNAEGTAITSNTATGGDTGGNIRGSGLGGAVYSSGNTTTITLTDVTVMANEAYGSSHNGTASAGHASGGVFYLNGGEMTVTDSTFSGNAAKASVGGSGTPNAYGGAIYLNNASLDATDTTFATNFAYGGNVTASGFGGAAQGGAVYGKGASTTITVTSSTFYNNVSRSGRANSPFPAGNSSGGAIYIESGSLDVTSSTLTSNTASRFGGSGGTRRGGAVYSQFANVDFDFTTVSGNTSVEGGTGLFVISSGSAVVDITNSIFGQTANTSTDIAYAGTATTTGSRNLVRNTVITGLDIVATTDPKLSALADNGGPTLTMALQANSPALNAAGIPSRDFDQRGSASIMFGQADIGAFESTVSGPSISSAATAAFLPNEAGTFTVTTAGNGTISLSLTGTLPDGMDFGDNTNGTATLWGTPTELGTFPLTITANNGFPGGEVQSFVLIVGTSPAFTSDPATTFIAGVAGSFTITTSGSPIPQLTAMSPGDVPDSLTIVDNGDGTATLSGTVDPADAGLYDFVFSATNGVGSGAMQTFTLVIESEATITSDASTTFTPGVTNSFTVSSEGFPSPALAITGLLPAGVTFTDNNDGTATITGVPTLDAEPSYAITITATNGVGAVVSQSFTLNVNASPVFTSGAAGTFEIGVDGTLPITTTGIPAATFSITSGSLPLGLALVDNNDGTASIAGSPIPQPTGEYTVELLATNSAGATTQTVTLTLHEIPAITSSDTATFEAEAARSFTITSTGYPTASLTLTGTLPIGLTFTDNGDGTATIDGTPTDDADSTVTLLITASNGTSSDATQSLSLAVNKRPAGFIASGTRSTNTVEFSNADGTPRFSIEAPLGKTKAQLRIGYGDLTNDGSDDVIITGGRGAGSKVAVFDGMTGDVATEFHAFKPSFQPGLYVATGDVNGDGIVDIIVGQGQGSRSSVKIFSGADQSEIAYFRVFDGKYGVRVAAADLNGDGFAEVIGTQDEAGGRTTVRIYDGQALSQGTVTKIADYRPFGDNYRYGAYVTTGDVNADGTPDVILGQAATRTPQVSVFSGSDNSLIANLQMQATRGGVRVSTSDFDNDGHADIVAGAIVGQTFVVKTISGANQTLLDEQVTEFKGSVFIA